MRLPVLATLLTAGLSLTPLFAQKKVILDTDPSFDPDDAGCMAMLHAIATNDEIEILAVMNCTDFHESPISIGAINQFYHRKAIPVGDYKRYGKKPSPETNYDYGIANDYPGPYSRSEDVPEAYRLYREILASQPDKSVTIIAIGTLHNLEELLQSAGDSYSPLDGKSLVERKVAQVVTMGGNFINHSGFDRTNWGGSNELCDDSRTWACLNEQRNALTRYVIEHCRAPFIASGWENGNGNFNGAQQGNVISGQRLKELESDHIVRRSYEMHFASRGGSDRIERHSNDQCALLYAVKGATSYYTEYIDGEIELTKEGACQWTRTSGGNQGYIAKRMPDQQLAKVIEDLMLLPPMAPDRSPPSAPGQLASAVRDSRVDLTWKPARDDTPGSWVSGYNVYRNGHQIGRASGTQFFDYEAVDGSHTYEVSAINVNGIEGERVALQVRLN